MNRAVVICAALVGAVTAGSRGQNISPFDPTPDRLIDVTAIAEGAAVGVNNAGQVLVITDARGQGGPAGSTFIWSKNAGLQEIRFDGTTAATRGSVLGESGYIAGLAVSPRGLLEPFIWSASTGMKLASPDLVMEHATAVAINDAGELVGVDVQQHSAYRAGGGATSRKHPLGADFPTCDSNATAISHWGEAVGASTFDPTGCTSARSPGMHAYLVRRDGSARDLGTFGGARSQAVAVNDRGQVAGWSENANGKRHAFLWTADTGMVDLGTLGGTWSEAMVLSDGGHAAGVSETASGERHAFVWSPATGMVDIGAGTPSGINNLGQVCGTSTLAGTMTAFVWSPADGRHVLGDGARALDLNDRGQIVGSASTITQSEAAVVWEVSITDTERINWYDGRTAVLEYARLITPDRADLYRKWIAEARGALSKTAESGTPNEGLIRLSRDLGEPGSPMTATPLSVAAALATPATGGGAYNLKVVTDASPDLTDLNSFINSTTSRWPSAREKVWALFYWSHILKRQTPPIVRHGWELTDPIRNLTDFGTTQCSTISGINQSLFEALGLRHQFWDICMHSVSAVEYDGSFHLIDSSMSNLVTKDDGVTLASVQEAAADSARLVRQRSLYSTSPDGFLTGSDSSRNLTDFAAPDGSGIVSGFSGDFCENGLYLRSYYYNWDSGHRHILNLRDHETYTRYYRRLGSTDHYWVGAENRGDPAQTWEIDPENRFGLRGNGSWSFTPDLGPSAYAQSVYRAVNIAPAASGGLQPNAAGAIADAVFKVQAADVIASQAIQAQFSRTDVSATATIAVSLNHGRTWAEVATVGSSMGPAVAINKSLRNEVNGAYETLIRVQMTAGKTSAAGIVLTALHVDTVTQVNARALPKLNIGRNEIYVGAGDQTDSMVLWPDLRGNLWQQDVYASSNIASQGLSINGYTAVVYPANLSQVAFLTYRMDSPADITRLVYGGRLYNRAAGASIDFLHSFDNGATWIQAYHFTGTSAPYDVIHYETVTAVPAGVRSVLFKYQIRGNAADTHPPGLYSVRMEADYTPPAGGSRPIDVTFRWKEVRSDRTLVERAHKQRVSVFPSTYTIDVGGSDHPVMESLSAHVEGAGDGTPYGYSDGIDVGGQKFVDVERTDGTNFAVGRPYSFTVPPSGFQSSAGATNQTILTDGVVGAPASGGTAYWWGQCWNPGPPFDIEIDLGQQQNVSAFRAHLFGYPFTDALRGTVDDTIEIFTSTDKVTYLTRGLLPMSVWKKDIPINYMLQDDETATGWNFEHRLSTAVPARYVRYQITPNRILCASELQVFDRIDYRPLDIRIALPDAVTPPPTDTTPPTVVVAAPASGATVSGSVTLSATASDNTGVTQVAFIVDGVTVASVYTAPFSAAWDSSAVANGAHLVTARARDAAGNTGTSPAVSITVANNFPATLLPGTVQAEDFDNGGYYDTTPGNSGGMYRNTGVDIEATVDGGGGYNVGWVAAGEWLQFTVDVSSAGRYTAGFRVASPGTGGTFHLEANGANVTGPLTIPNTGGWQAWTTVTRDDVSLAAGLQLIRLVMDTNATSGSVGNFNWISVAPSNGTLPNGWSDQDIGNVGVPGSASYSNGVFTQRGSGADIWGSADSFNLLSRSLSGDGQVVARINSLQNTSPYAKAGVMLRDTSSAGSPHVILDLKPDGHAEFMTRSWANGGTTYLAGTAVGLPGWLRLSRSGSTVTAAVSTNGTTWTTVGTTPVAATANSLAGIAVTSHSATLTTAIADNVTVTNTPVTPVLEAATAPGPSAGATGIETTPTLTWTASGATSYDVSFGTSNPPPLVSTAQTTTLYQPPALAGGTTYFWRIVSKNASRSVTGPVWSFSTSSGNSAARVGVWLTTADRQNLLSQQSALTLAADTSSNPLTIDLDESTKYQQMDGFGASLTDSSAWLLWNAVAEPTRTQLMKQLFDAKAGIGISYLRQPMGASDFAVSDYTYDDMPAGQSDPDLTQFSIDHDRTYIIPLLQQALQINPSLRLLATPWSPPAWMKSNQSLFGGALNADATTMTALANYFVKFVQQYAAAGLPIHRVTPQNEPLYAGGTYPTMGMDEITQATFIRQYLAPAFQSAGVPTQIAAYDHNWDNTAYPANVLGSAAGAFVSGTAWHCYAGTPDAMSTVHAQFPAKDVYLTECAAFEDGQTFGAKLRYDLQNLVIGSARNWARTVIKWNIALDSARGPHIGGCDNCAGLLTIDRTASPAVISFNYDYYALGHVSKFVQPGAYRVGSSSWADSIEDVAFVNPDGTGVVIVMNLDTSAHAVTVRRSGQSVTYTLTASAATTFTLPAPGSLPAPSAPTNPSPANGAAAISATPTLSWTATGATTYDVALGTTNPPPTVVSGLTAFTYTPAALTPSTTYYWRVLARNATASTTGALWSFTTLSPPPGMPGSPSPASGATGVSTSATLTWSATGASTYSLAFGTSSPPPTIATGLSVAAYTPTAMTPGTTYYWQVTASNASGSATGPVWSFSAASSDGMLPSGWSDQDIGAVGLAGGATYSNGTFTIKGAGADIWGTADAFNFASQALAGDGQIVARVTNLQNTGSYAKAGVMLRDSVAAGSAQVILDVKPDGSVEFMQRSLLNGSTAYLGGMSVGFPAWLRLTRSGMSVAAAVSTTGTTWTPIGTTAATSTSGLAGLAVTSHTTTALATAVIDNVAKTSGVTLSTPFTGTPISLPALFQVEDFDQGGAGIAYHDTSPGNSGAAYRTTDVDIQSAADSGGGYNVGWVNAGEWLNYTTTVASGGSYIIDVRVASVAAGGTFHIEANGADVTGPLIVPATGGWQSWATVTRSGVRLGTGTQILRIVMDSNGATGAVGNFNWVRISAAQAGSTPFTGTPVAVPGVFQAEDFDEGGAEVAYHDASPWNSGGMYRQTAVDIEQTSDTGGGYNVGWVSGGEWLNYTVNVSTPGRHAISVRVASPLQGGSFHLEAKGVDVTGPMIVPGTGSWQAWTTVTATDVVLEAGTQVLRLVMDREGDTGAVGNFNWVSIATTH